MTFGFGYPTADIAMPQSLLVVHLVAIGWLSLLMCGALFQFVPVLIARPLHSDGLPLPTLASLAAGLFLLAFLCPRANPRGAWVGIVLSLLVTAWATLTLDHGSVVNLGRWNYPLNSYMIGVIGHVVLFVAGYVASLVLPGDGSRELTLWGWLNHRRETALAEAVTEKAAGRLTGTF